MTTKRKAVNYRSGRRQRGYTLLEYCAGAAVVATVLWGALQSMGNNFQSLTAAIGSWAKVRAGDITATTPGK